MLSEGKLTSKRGQTLSDLFPLSSAATLTFYVSCNKEKKQ